MKTQMVGVSILLATLASALPGELHAAECKAPPYSASSTDVAFSKWLVKTMVDGTDTEGIKLWRGFGFHKNQGWDRENYGFDDYDNPDLPVGRSLNALFVMRYSVEDPDPEEDVLIAMFNHAAIGYYERDDLRAGECHSKYAARADRFLDYVILYQGTFQKNIIFRAGTFIHENWHHSIDKGHTCGDDGDDYFYDDYMILAPAGRGGLVPQVNPNPKTLSVYGVEALWYMAYAATADQFTKTSMWEAAMDLASSRLNNRICHPESIPENLRAFM